MQQSFYRFALCGLFSVAALPALGQMFPFHSGDSFSIVPMPGQSESYLGTYLSEVTPDLVDQLGLEEESGAHVNQVVADTPADEAGLQTDDVIIRWDDLRVVSARQLTRLVRETPPGRNVKLEVIRDGEVVTISAQVGTRPPVVVPEDHPPFFHRGPRDPAPNPHTPWYHRPFGDSHMQGPSDVRPRLGIIMQPLTDQLATYFELQDRLGALVSTVMEDTPAEEAGLQAGDVVLSVNGDDVESPRDVQRHVRQAEGESMNIRVMRKGEEVDITVQLADAEPVAADEPSESDEEESSDEPPTEFPPESM